MGMIRCQPNKTQLANCADTNLTQLGTNFPDKFIKAF